MQICLKYCLKTFGYSFSKVTVWPLCFYKRGISASSRSVVQGIFRQQPFAMNRVSDGWQNFDNYSVYAWSLSGLETCVVVKSGDFNLAFDMGCSIPQSISCANVFISHGHMDHVGAVASHAAKRGLFGMRKANYYVPSYLVENIKVITKASYEMAQTTEDLEKVNIISFDLDDKISLPSNYYMCTFPTFHRIPSQGYILYKEVKKLKPQYVGQSASTIAGLHRSGVPIHDIITTPEVAYTGDTTIDVFLNTKTPDLLRVKLLIMEATYIDNSDSVLKAKEFGHIHLQEISDNAHLFRDVKAILLIHFSTKYTSEYIHHHVSCNIPSELIGKVFCATVAKEHNS